MTDRISSLDNSYIDGDLSLFPLVLDSKNTLYEVKNNSDTELTQTLTYVGKFIVVKDTTKFPDRGILRIGTELIFYDSKSNTMFKSLKRGFAKTKQQIWPIGTKVTGGVMAEYHNAVLDATIKIEQKLGLKESPADESLNGILSAQERRFLFPKPVFKAIPRIGAAPLKIKFQNFSAAPAIRWYWEFGDGGSSVEASPTHTYLAEGTYTVRLHMITELGGTGIVTKNDYIVVNNDEDVAFFYVDTLTGTTSTEFNFVDQTKGDIIERYWIWDDGTNTAELDPYIHIASHTYATAGEYNPTLTVVYSDGKIRKVSLGDTIVVS